MPSLDDRVEVHRVIHDEHWHGRVLGCTEIMMLLEPDGGEVPRFDTTTLHAAAAVEAATAG